MLPVAALVAEARELIEQARAAEAERARVAAEEAEAAATVEAVAKAEAAAERLRLEEQVATLTRVMQSAATQLQEAQAQLGVPPAAPAPYPDDAEDQCVVCFDAPKDHLVLPCKHLCVRGVCGAVDQDENADVSCVPRAHPGDHEGFLLIVGLGLDENLRQVHVPVDECLCDGPLVLSTTRREDVRCSTGCSRCVVVWEQASPVTCC
jgi:hypothetical protein